ncbi:MAG: PA0069 family radical SAM protein [Pirellulaceae bacterium]
MFVPAQPTPDRQPAGRGTTSNPPNRYETMRLEPEEDQRAWWEERADERPPLINKTLFLPDRTQTILASNDSPDVPFHYSINPYRGCEHGCAYCYARPSHEQLGMSAGLDFESKILVKFDAAQLLRRELGRPGWRGEPIALSGVTDCYQPCEREFRITRSVLEVLEEARQATMIISKNALLMRDLDLLVEMARRRLVQVTLSITSLDAALARVLEPRTSSPTARMRTVAALAGAGVPVSVMVAPVIPGLNDHEMAAILHAAQQAGAISASYTLLRLPQSVGPLFLEWLDRHRPLARQRIESLIRSTRGGELNDSRFGCRMRGAAPYAEGIDATFRLFAHKYGLDHSPPPLDVSQFRPPCTSKGQRYLF